MTSPAKDTAQPLVLIVDDNEKNLKLARDVLRASGFRTLEAATAGEGIALTAEHLPDVVLMDLQLPDIDGAEAARMLSEDARTAGVPVVALSASRVWSDDGWTRGTSFAGYVEKPISVTDFPAQVRRYCGH